MGRLADGRAVFVHRTVPGETVETALLQEKSRWARGRLLWVIDASVDRRVAPCPHYAECGGCTLEHLEYPAQLRAKAKIVAEALRRIGGLELKEPEVVASPHEFRYRNRVSFALRRLGRGDVRAGFHALYDPDRITPVDGSCLLPEVPIAVVWERMRTAWGPDAHLLPSGEILRLTLRATAPGAVSLLIEGGYSSGRPNELLAAVPGLEAIWHRRAGSSAEHVAGSPGLPETWGDENFELGGAAFLQVNRSAAALLERHVLAACGSVAERSVVDGYCGVGIHGRQLARAGARVVGIELDENAVLTASRLAPEGATFRVGRVEEHLSAVLPTDLLIVNPPRAGLTPAVTAAVLEQPPSKIIYISCDPATLARDLGRLTHSYGLSGIRCFDLFPQTAHVESVVELERR